MTPRRLIEPARLAGSAVLRTQSDDRLVDLVREGNEQAFEAIVHRYRRALLRYCGRFLSGARAEDAVQQAFVNAYSALRGGSAEVRLRPWLYRIAHNAALNALRQAGADTVPVDEQIDGVETPPQAFERGERFRSVVAAVQGLPERQRDAIVLQALEGRSYEEIAGEMGVSDGAVRQLLNRARTTLREAATAVTPLGLVARMGGAVDAPVAERVAQVVAGAGGSALLVKGVAVLAVAGGVVGGTTSGVLPGVGGGSGGDRPAAVLAPEPAEAATGGGGESPSGGATPISDRGDGGAGGGSSGERRRGDENRGEGRGGGDAGRDDDGGGGPNRGSSGGDDEDNSGRGGSDDDEDNSGRGGSDDDDEVDDDHSGHGGGGDDDAPEIEIDDDSSGPGSGGSDDPPEVEVDDSDVPEVPDVDDEPDDSDSSGPGSGGSGSSGSGSSGSGRDALDDDE
jgi:RNA polymerase sigma factor (sigma-70 family)